MIIIKQPQIVSADGRSRLTAELVFDGESHPLWFEVPSEYERFLCSERSDAFVLAVIQYAIRHGHDIRCEAPMTERLHRQLTEQFLEPFRKINGLKHPFIDAPTAPEVEHPADGNHVGTGVSCGVDSMHVFAMHPDVEYGCLWNTGVIVGYNDWKDHDRGWEGMRRRSGEFIAAIGKKLLIADTNFDHKCISGLQWDFMTTYGNLFCIFALQKFWSRYYVASDCDIMNFRFKFASAYADPARYEYFLFPHVCLADIQVLMDGAAHNRLEKVRDLTSYPPARKFLNVCWRINDGHRNGSNDCPKCMRTMLDLDACGAIDDFGEVFDVAYYHRNLHEYLAEYYRGLLQKDNFALEMVSAFKDRRFPLGVRLRAGWIVFKKMLKKLLRGGKTKSDGFSSKG